MLRQVVTVLMAVWVLSGCAAALMGRAASTGTSTSPSTPTSSGSAQRSSGASAGAAGTRSAAQIEHDRQIAATVRSRLLADVATKSLVVGVDAYQGVVSLRGDVAKAEQRSAAERVARNVAGVRQVRNELKVR